MGMSVEPLDETGYIVSDSEILGGYPIIKGTRLLVNTVRRRIDAGDPFEMLERELPMIPPEAFRAAYGYANEHPPLPREPRPTETKKRQWDVRTETDGREGASSPDFIADVGDES
jgi:uncharacterized protein (DUF433 family)